MNYTLEAPREEHIWDFYYDLLIGFVDRQGHTDLPKQHIEKGFALGIWVHKQRDNRHFLSPDRIAALEEIECWFWDKKSTPVRQPEVPAQTIASSPRVTETMSKSPSAEAERRRTIVSIDSKNRLVQRRSDGSVKRAVTDDDEKQKENEIWQSRYRLLIKYLNREGDCLVPSNHVEEGFNLGSWVVRQRLKRNNMAEQRRGLLESLGGWYWDNPQAYRQKKHDTVRPEKLEQQPDSSWDPEDTRNPTNSNQTVSLTAEKLWESMFRLLEQYGKREGHYNVPKSHEENGRDLGEWVKIQRKAHAILLQKHRVLLDSLDGWLWQEGPRDLYTRNIDDLAHDVCAAVSGSGPINDVLAAYHAVQALQKSGLIAECTVRVGSPVLKRISQAFDRAVQLGIMDRPAHGKIRSLPTNSEYQVL